MMCVSRLALFAVTVVGSLVSTSLPAATCTEYQSARTEWLSKMQSVGKTIGQRLEAASAESQTAAFVHTYYDSALVFREIALWTGQTEPWRRYSSIARDAYVLGYLEPNNFGAAGWWVFPHGLYWDWKDGGRTTKDEILKLRDKPAFSHLNHYVGEYLGTKESMSRELAYALQAQIQAEKAGFPRAIESNIAVPLQLVSWAENHFAEWENGTGKRFAPFMAGLLASALIEFIEWEEANGRNPNASWRGDYGSSIVSSMTRFFRWAHAESKVRNGALAGSPMWMSQGGLRTFRYQDLDEGADATPVPGWEAGNLIAYPYAWLSRRLESSNSATDLQTARLFMGVSEDLFVSTARMAWIEGGGKFFNQAYRTSFTTARIHDTSGVGACESSVRPRSPESVVVN